MFHELALISTLLQSVSCIIPMYVTIPVATVIHDQEMLVRN